jgi:hypothetical protein
VISYADISISPIVTRRLRFYHRNPPVSRALPKGDKMRQSIQGDKRKRQYQHVKESVLHRGGSEKRAEEIAGRTVNKVRAQHGESKTASPTSVNDLSPSRRGGLRSHSGAAGRTYAQLYAEARTKKISGRSTMTKAELLKALGDWR